MVEFKQRQTAPSPTLDKSSRLLDSSFFNAFKPIYHFSRAIGLMPYSIECDSKGIIQRSRVGKLDIAWFIVSLSIYMFAALASFKYLDVYDNALKILVVCDNFHLTLGLSFGFLLIANDMCKRFTFVDLLQKFNIFDKEVIGVTSDGVDSFCKRQF